MSTWPVMIIALCMIVVGAGFIYYLIRSNESGRPEGALQWGTVVLSTLLIVCAGLLLVLSIIIHTDGGSGPRRAALAPTADAVDVGQRAPSLSFRLVQGDQPAELEAYQGKVVLLNFWATWCAPCLRELPDLNRLQEDYDEQGLVVLTVSDESREELVAFMDKMPLQTVTAYLPDPDEVPDPFGKTLGIRPTSYIIDRDGTIRRFVKGARTYAFFESAVTPYL